MLNLVSGGHVLSLPYGNEEVDPSWVQTSQGNKSLGTSSTEKIAAIHKTDEPKHALSVYAYWIHPSASINLPSATASL